MPRSPTTKKDDEEKSIKNPFNNEPMQIEPILAEPDSWRRNNNDLTDATLRSASEHVVGFDVSSNSSSSEGLEVEDDDDVESANEDPSRPTGIVNMILPNISKFAEWPRDKKVTSDPVIIRCLPWRILVMQRMSDVQNGKFRSPPQVTLGFFIQCNAENSSHSWSCHADARLSILSQREGCKPRRKTISHTFYAKENDWGFVNFLTLKEILNPDNGFVKNDSIHLRVYVRADAPHGSNWNSKKYTGFVGIKNQGATCYMNSLLQALYFTNKLRKAVYQIPTDPDDRLEVPLCLQWLFYDLQHSHDFVDTKRLTRSFGWESSDSFMQHDVQELCRVLLENLEKKMKGTIVADTIPNLFCGRMLSYVRCKHVPLVSEREENFYDIQLKVKDNRSIYDAFKDYIAVETLNGDNLYNAGEFGMQEAEKGVLFLRYPPVLYLQLMRFQYDPETDANIKINDRFEFPYSLNLDPFLKESVTSDPATFFLHAVLVHSGDQHGGHYVVYINPRGDGKWYKFDDDVVSSCSSKEAIDGNYGGHSLNSELGARKYCSNAYMLVYIRESAKLDVLAPLVDSDIPNWMRDKFAIKQKESDEIIKEAHLNIILEEDFQYHQGHFLCEYLPSRTLTYPRSVDYADFLKLLANKLQQDVHCLRPWTFKPKQNFHIRAYLQHLSEARFHAGRFKEIWVEILPNNSPITATSLQLGCPPDVDHCLLFVKSYDNAKEELTYLGHVLANIHAPLWNSLDTFKQKIVADYNAAGGGMKATSSTALQFLLYIESDVECDVQGITIAANDKLEDILIEYHWSPKEDGYVVVLQYFTPPPHLSNLYPINNASLLVEHNNPLAQQLSAYYRFSSQRMRILFMDRRKLLSHVKFSTSSATTTSLKNVASSKQGGQGMDETSGGMAMNIVNDEEMNISVLAQHPLLMSDVVAMSDVVDKFGGFIVTMLMDMTYWQIVDIVVKHIQQLLSLTITKEHIQLFVASQTSDTAIPSTTRSTLQEILLPSWVNTLSTGQSQTITTTTDPQIHGQVVAYRLFYQILTMPIDKVEAMQHLRIRYVLPNLLEELELNICLEPNAIVGDLLDAVAKNSLVVNGEIERPYLRLWEATQYKLLHRIIDEDRRVDEILANLLKRTLNRILRVYHRPIDERKQLEKGKESFVLKVAHFHKDPATTHGIPFSIQFSTDDTLDSVAERIRKRLDISVKEFAKWQICLLYNNQVRNIGNDEKLFIHYQNYLSNCPEDDVPLWIGLDHRMAPKRTAEKAIVIHN